MKTIKKRYIALKIESNQKITYTELKRELWNAVITLFGEYGASKTALKIIKYDWIRKLVILRITNASMDMMRAAICSITTLNNVQVVFHVTTVSGTLKSLNQKIKIP